MKIFFLFLSCFALGTTYAQDLCIENFTLTTQRISESEGVVRPEGFFPLKSTIARNADTITVTFHMTDEKFDARSFAIHKSNCDTLINSEKAIVFRGVLMEPKSEVDKVQMTYEQIPLTVVVYRSGKEVVMIHEKKKSLHLTTRE